MTSSYLRYGDLPLARALHDEPEALDTEVWMDDFSIKLGQHIIRAIDRGISLFRVVLYW